MSDPSTLAIVASNLLGKTYEEVTPDGFTLTYTINTLELAVQHAIKLLKKTTPSLHG